MFGDDPMKKDEIPYEDRDKSFTFEGKWQGSGSCLEGL